jgi:hypothetical protein
MVFRKQSRRYTLFVARLPQNAVSVSTCWDVPSFTGHTPKFYKPLETVRVPGYGVLKRMKLSPIVRVQFWERIWKARLQRSMFGGAWDPRSKNEEFICPGVW